MTGGVQQQSLPHRPGGFETLPSPGGFGAPHDTSPSGGFGAPHDTSLLRWVPPMPPPPQVGLGPPMTPPSSGGFGAPHDTSPSGGFGAPHDTSLLRWVPPMTPPSSGGFGAPHDTSPSGGFGAPHDTSPSEIEQPSCSLQYGFINSCLQSLVMERFGQETWDKLSSLPGVQESFMTYMVYDDKLTLHLVQEACSLLDVSAEVFLKLFGEHFFVFCKKAGYDTMLRTLGGTLIEFIGNLDALHSYLALSYQEMNAPSFRVEMTDDGTMLLHYYSDRKGLYHIVPGIIEAVARDFFDSKVTMMVLNQSEEDERTGKKEHVVFLVEQTNQASKTTDLSSHRGEALFRTMRGRCASLAGTKSGWDLIKAVVCSDKGIPHCTFSPCYPDKLWVEEKAFCHAFPFHIVFDEDLKVRQMGVNIQRFLPGLQARDATVDQLFTIIHPQVTFTIENIRKFINSQFVLKSCKDTHTTLKLRGQMLWMESLACMLYLCSPKLRSLQELQDVGLYLADLAQHDVTRDLVLLNQQRLAEMELTNQLEKKKEELRILSQHLEAEKEKTETLLYAMLPRHIANQLKDGKSVEAGEFEVCTILFSDVVTFTSICAACEPIHIVHLLNSMYSKFDRLTSIHDIYKVETIGDAYMVVGGVPVPTGSHAHRVANFALGMRIAAREVLNPVTGKPIQIRVGLHTGPVLAGVVGDKMPRYCLFGDSVNTASRMESHGVPDHIHLSTSTYRALKDAGFNIQERGQIEVKGKGLMTTYFLLGNLLLSEESIMGREVGGAGLYREDLYGQSKRESEVRTETVLRDTGSDGAGAPNPSPPDSMAPFAWDISPPFETADNSSNTSSSRLCVLL
ncbi:guanylate cyclase soluble subunit beta-2 [Cyclopterus lumpus]|uniref:guanylate cyclase soluble subunit beta-2 n=1 Tax=Cyclopterus lumpus TaxID=8103 RepID=UPI001485F728|nr:guanylate cyclase soluble subunit beta-2 [Cyclopterus lumpus]